VNILIAYASKSGTTREAAEMLAELLTNHTVTLADLGETTPVPGDFDYIVIGGPIRMGKAHKALRRYLASFDEALCKIPHTLFLCCSIPHQFEHYLECTFSQTLRESAEEALYFGGELNLSKQRGLDKLIVRMIRSSIEESVDEEDDEDAVLPGLLPEHIRMLADRLRVK
jgi:menaquinone-dependent protoporphyrinogen oxidase